MESKFRKNAKLKKKSFLLQLYKYYPNHKKIEFHVTMSVKGNVEKNPSDPNFEKSVLKNIEKATLFLKLFHLLVSHLKYFVGHMIFSKNG